MKIIFSLLLFCISPSFAGTRNIVPRATDEGNIGLSTKPWHGVYATTIYGAGSGLTGVVLSTGATMTGNLIVSASVQANILQMGGDAQFSRIIANQIDTGDGDSLNIAVGGALLVGGVEAISSTRLLHNVTYSGDGSPLTGIITSTAAIVLSTGVIQANVDTVILSTGTLVRKAGDTMTGVLLHTMNDIGANTAAQFSFTAARLKLRGDTIGTAGMDLGFNTSLNRGYIQAGADDIVGPPFDSPTYYPLMLQVKGGNTSIGLANADPTAALVVYGNTVSSGTIYAQNGFYGSGSSLTGIITSTAAFVPYTGASSVLNMGAYGVITASNTSSARYQINGATVVAIIGTNAIAIGDYAGNRNTGADNTFVGANSALINTTGSQNTVVGRYAMASNVSGISNTLMGSSAGYGVTASGVTGIGYAALNAASGNNSTGVGFEVGKVNTAINFNGLGYWAGYSNTTGTDNAIFGNQGAKFNQTGSRNSILGNEAGLGVTLNSFSESVFIGYQAGYSIKTGSGNINIGYKAGYTTDVGTGNIIIGYNQNAPTAGTSNYLNIGGVIKGDLASGNINIPILTASSVTVTGAIGQGGSRIALNVAGDSFYFGDMDGINTRSVFRGAGTDMLTLTGSNLYLGGRNGIGTSGVISTYTATTGELEIPKVTVTGSAFSVGGSTLVVAGGSVGVGVTPLYPLHIYHPTATTPLLYMKSDGQTGLMQIRDTYNTGIDIAAQAAVGGAYILGQGAYSLFLGANNTKWMTILSGGNVGIGTTAPLTNLQIAYSSATTSGGIFSGITVTNTNGTAGTTAALMFGESLAANGGKQYIAGVRTGGSGVGDLIFGASTVADANPATIADEKMRITSGGNVGIGNTSPTTKLHVSSGTLTVDGSGGTTEFGRVIVSSESTTNAQYLVATCPAGTTIMSGGYSSGATLKIPFVNYPVSTTAWRVGWWNSADTTWSAYAICDRGVTTGP